MTYTIYKEFWLEAAHQLSSEDCDNEKIFGMCTRLHGHSYKVGLFLQSDKLVNGMVVNFKTIKRVYKEKVEEVLDHSNLNDAMILPTAEHIANYIYTSLKQTFIQLKKVRVWETNNSYAEYGEGKE